MKITQKHESGFGTVEVLLVILILLVIGVIGYMVYHNNHKSSTASVGVTSANLPPTSGSSSNKTSTSPATDNISIAPLGISLTVPANVSDLTYAQTSTSSFNGESSVTVGISTSTLTSYGSACDASNAPLFLLTRVNGQYPANANVYNSPGILVKQFPDFYISFTPNNGQTKCAALGTAQSDTLNNELNALLRFHVSSTNGQNSSPTPEFTVHALQ